jgi:AraC-like DNA-binding protein/CheY-like chemotaxis protein
MCAAPEPDSPNKKGYPRILILDPDPMLAEALALALQRRAQIEWVPAGMAGLMVVAKREVDLAIVEVHLPDMSSADLMGLLRLLRPCLPIGLLRADPHVETPGECECEADVQFPKPFDLTVVLTWIADRLGERVTCWPKSEPSPATGEIPPQHLEVVRCVLEVLDRRHGEETPPAMIAQEAGVSRWHLCRIFKRVTGLSLKRFLTRRRLQAAKALLREPGVPIHQVASDVGYRDASHFDRVFRRWEGQTPSRYRRQATLQRRRTGIPPAHNPHFRTGPPFSI